MDEKRLVINKTREEAQYLHNEGPTGTPDPVGATPVLEPKWDPNNSGGQASLKRYKRCIMEGLRKGVPKQRSLNLIQTL